MIIPKRARDLPKKIKPIKIITLSENIIIWKILETDNIVTLNKSPLCLKFKNNGDDFEKLIKKHFNEMGNESAIRRDACRRLRDSISAGIIDGEERVTYNSMSLLHFFGTWLGPTINPFAKGHAIMNNLHYELFGFHQYHGKQYRQNSRNEWTNLLNDCLNDCLHKTCLKHAKNRNTGNETMGMHFYKNSPEVFLAYHNYIDFFLEIGNCEMENLCNNQESA